MIEELERLARAAELQMLNGEWWSQHSLRYHLRVADGTCPETDPPYIAALSPDRVLRLLEVVKQAKLVAPAGRAGAHRHNGGQRSDSHRGIDEQRRRDRESLGRPVRRTGRAGGGAMSRIPPLPEPVFLWDRPEYPHFTADQLRARDRQIVEACAKACEVIEGKHWEAFKRGKGPERASDFTQGQSDGASECAAALRSLLGEGEGKE